jgi:hypothetical protein
MIGGLLQKPNAVSQYFCYEYSCYILWDQIDNRNIDNRNKVTSLAKT